MYFIFFAFLYFYSFARGSIYTFTYSGVLISLIAIYDILRINSDNYIMVLTGLTLVSIFILFMTLSPLYSKLNTEKEVPDRITG
jgi:hypothetical protein